MTMAIRGPGRAGAAAMAAALTLGALGLSGCASARNTLGTNASPCYSALPVADSAVHGRGSFAGVLLIHASSLGRRQSGSTRALRAELDRRAGHVVQSVCVVAYFGSFSPSQVSRFFGATPATGKGRYAVVVVEYPGNVLLGTFIRNAEPLRFRHSRVGA